MSNKTNLILGIMCLILGLLMASCTQKEITVPQETKIKPHITPDKPNQDTFTVTNRDL